MKLSCFIINLKDSPQNFEKQHPFLLEEGLDPVRFIGVDARKDEHLEYREYVTEWCQTMCPKAVIGCGLSHVLLARHIRDLGLPMALVLEDDAYPKVQNLLERIYETIREVPEDWDIIKLHCGFCLKGTHNSTGASAAAYLLSASGIQKMAELKVNFHVDAQMNSSDFKIYKSRYNLFWTDESWSTIRTSNSTSFSFKIPFLTGTIYPIALGSAPLLRIPFLDINFTNFHCCLVVICILFFIFRPK